ncbi:MAG: hypothetical protein AABW51_01405 [Nanoarchaeota archaeon]
MAPPFKKIEIGRQIIQQAAQVSLATEFLYSFTIIVISLMIYFGTREFYNLTSHRGIKYFRSAFLFFAIAFFFRSFIKFLVILFDVQRILDLSLQTIGSISLFLFMYASAMAIFYLLFSVMWKKWSSEKILLFHLLAAIIALITIIIKNVNVILIMHFVLFIFIAVVTWISYQESKKIRKGSHLHGIYILLFAFWILNIIDLLTTNALSTFHLLIYIASFSVFATILYKVLRKVG